MVTPEKTGGESTVLKFLSKLIVLATLLVPSMTFAQQFVSPIGGVPFKDWTIVNYLDLEAGSGVTDWNGGNFSYDGHDAIDFTLPNFAAMDAGISVLAARSGIVVATHDGEFDRWSRANPTPSGASANFVIIDHGNGVETHYWHLKKNSISVAVGDSVVTGQQIAQVGSSGYSSDAHLHFTVFQNNVEIETYLNPSYWWASPLPYAGDVAGALDSGIVDHSPTTEELVERPNDYNIFDLLDGAGQRVVSWALVHGFADGDSVDYYFRRPDGSEQAHWSWTTGQIRYGWWEANIILPADAPLGTWTIEAQLNGVTYLEDTFEVIRSTSVPVAASPLSPEGTIATNTPTYSWNAVAGASWYYLWVQDAVGTPVKRWYRAGDVGCDPDGLCTVTPSESVVGNVKWWIQTWNSAGFGPWSESLSFSTSGTCGALSAPVALSPIGTTSSMTPEYRWQPVCGATWYQLWVDDVSGNKINRWYRSSETACVVSNGDCNITPAETIEGNAVWWVRAWSAQQAYGPWSGAQSFNP